MAERNYYGTKIIRHSSSLGRGQDKTSWPGRVWLNSPFLGPATSSGALFVLTIPCHSLPYHLVPELFCEGLGLGLLGTPGKPTIRKRHNLTT